jgi:DNA invertase Pin-like site-specific DNA recombinase
MENRHRGAAILYARISTDEQIRSGYSLAQQLEALREWVEAEGYEGLEEVADPGQIARREHDGRV